MSLDIDNILDELIIVARGGIGTLLSEIGPVGSEFPAVIRVRQEGPKPEYPYCVISLLDISDGGEWLLEEYLDSSNNLVYESNKNLLINYRVYGGNALSISNTLHGYFRRDSVLNQIRENTGGAVVDTGSIDSLPVLLSDTYLESASFSLTLAITDTDSLADTGENYFDSVELDGGLHNGLTDPPALDVDITAP